ncbi:ROK family protein [Skermanella mucosa]|uniref:ROK family protein n=1 Tax=Skermanella mucosa TaxID=1789672 RepID=UPI00192C9217|nr:ROK family protein [Skermanella mucosa]UEM23618.1 ROK family protein [Skermanella mucosa]
MIRIGIDLGGTKIEGIAIDRNGRELSRRRIGTPRGNYAATLDSLAGLVSWLEEQAGDRGTVGIGIPGVVLPPGGLVRKANSTWLIGHALGDDLSGLVGRPVRVQNDANCFAVSEAADGAGAGFGTVFGAIVGTGTGAGIVTGGRVLTGRNGIAGEWGHTSLPWPGPDEYPGPACYCGRPGCIETWISGPAFAADHARITGEQLSGQEIAAKADAGDPGASASLERYAGRLARSLAMVIDVLDPDVIVLGGGMSNVARLYAMLPPLLSRWCISDTVDTPVVPARHGDSSGVRGAAWLWSAAENAAP